MKHAFGHSSEKESKHESGRDDLCQFSELTLFFKRLQPGNWYIRKEVPGGKVEYTVWNDSGETHEFLS